MRNTVYDVIIIGAGPAGATLARLIGRERSVLLLDSRLMGPHGFTRGKCCGGLLAPDGVRQLRAMGLALPDFPREAAQPLTVRAVDLHSGHDRRYARQYVNLDRVLFESWLLSLLLEGVTFLDGARCCGIGKTGDFWNVAVAERGAGRSVSFRAACVVSAEGASSLVRRHLDPDRRRMPLYFAVQDVYERFGGPEASRCEYAAFFHPLFTDFYGWVIPKKERVLVGAALPPRFTRAYNVDKRMQALRQALRCAGYEFGGAVRREACLLARPHVRDIFLGAQGAFCVGEAAGFISPSSAEGFSYAFGSARALAAAILAGKKPAATLAAYKRSALPLMANIAWKTVKSCAIHTPPLRRFFMRGGILAMKR